MAESLVAAIDDHSVISTEIPHSDLGEKASLVDADHRIGDVTRAPAAAAAEEEHGHYTSDLLRRAEVSKLSEDPGRDRRDREATMIILTF
ncbi:Os11g0664300 [Oryza sativa Japonica Group]|uniref:Expressed protein n=2 Tax=Oryza sativa subsp. japonica TaxID=39947 RepID=Q2QZZ7_ORYSJ|nr:expressed protein [Oryza sativa Japonica Group]EAZ19209.1 hypothetical protein OsJ_34748 [Oryza sativa Japonica Group]BAT15161.1 Os11g0664300 [Oryza sativa Japonica Group]